MNDQKNTLIAILLSALVLIGWQYFVGMPQMEKQRQEAQIKAQQQQQQQQTQQPTPAAPGVTTPQAPGTAPQLPGQGGAASPVQQVTREAVLAASPRIAVETPRLKGSIALKGGRIDDLALSQYRETVDPKSPAIVLLSPSGSPHPFYAEFGWVAAAGSNIKLPSAETVWRQQGSGSLGVDRPITLVYDNGEGLEFRRTIAVDDKYMFTVDDQVVNKGAAPLTLFPYSLISRHGTPETLGYYILHEGLIGFLGEQGLQEVTYSKIEEKKNITFKVTNAWFGITDKYWAATLIPAKTAQIQARFSAGTLGPLKTYQTDYLGEGVSVAPAGTAAVQTRLFAGAKEVGIVDGYQKAQDINQFDLLIDWGWFYFITKPMFKLLDYFFHLVGNFGFAILIVTVIIKIVFFPLANKSYASMAKMKAVQPQMLALRERYPDDKMKQQQEMMELYKREKINPLAGCLPIVVQIPVFFALYKVLFVTIEMRHAPFLGWIKDLSAPDPTNLFSLFGLLPEPTAYLGAAMGSFLHLGVWPIIMGITMWFQMKLNPAPPDPTQKMIFDWMPLIFTFMLTSFSAGLVIYWAWNNTLSVLQQGFIMKKHGAKIELWDNLRGTWDGIKSLFSKKSGSSSTS